PPARAAPAALPFAAVGPPGLRGEVAVDAADFEFTYYLMLVRNRIAQNWTPPAGGAQEAKSVVYFKIARDGSIVDRRIEEGSGSGKRIPILCESFQGGGDRTARESSVIADTVLANDLANSGVFDVTRSWIGVAAGTEQAVVGGKWIVNGNQLRLEGEVHDLPA